MLWISLALALPTPPPQAVPPRAYIVSAVDGAALAETCAQKKSGDVCEGYILATYDTLSFNGLICPTSAAQATGDALAIGRKALADSPYTGKMHPTKIIGDAFRKAYPCT